MPLKIKKPDPDMILVNVRDYNRLVREHAEQAKELERLRLALRYDQFVYDPRTNE